MNKGRKIKGTSWFLCGLIAAVCCFGACGKRPSGNGKNLIYVIGDGMGFQHIENAKLYMEAEALSFEEYYVGEVATYSADSAVTDSAASATALATGIKTNNSRVGMDAEGNVLENLMEISKKEGKKTGVVTTDTLNGATPAGFSAHALDRGSTVEIMDSQKVGKVDLLMGNHSGYYEAYCEEFENEGFKYAETVEELQAFSKKGKIVMNTKDLAPTYGEEDSTGITPLKTLVEYALDFLSKDKDGFTLMVEGAYIDKHSHSNDIFKMLYAFMDLNDAVEYILDWASKRTDTSVIITADHETGGLQKAVSKEEISNALYTSTGHTASNVPLYLYNATTALTAIDNTDVFNIAKQIVTG